MKSYYTMKQSKPKMSFSELLLRAYGIVALLLLTSLGLMKGLPDARVEKFFSVIDKADSWIVLTVVLFCLIAYVRWWILWRMKK